MIKKDLINEINLLLEKSFLKLFDEYIAENSKESKYLFGNKITTYEIRAESLF